MRCLLPEHTHSYSARLRFVRTKLTRSRLMTSWLYSYCVCRQTAAAATGGSGVKHLRQVVRVLRGWVKRVAHRMRFSGACDYAGGIAAW
jgi:hypothetical protein